MASPTQTSDRGDVPAGHWWKEEDRVKSYVAANDAVAGEIAAVFDLLTAVLTYVRVSLLRVLDIVNGHCYLAAAFLCG